MPALGSNREAKRSDVVDTAWMNDLWNDAYNAMASNHKKLAAVFEGIVMKEYSKILEARSSKGLSYQHQRSSLVAVKRQSGLVNKQF